jgi:hypothetical protein
MSYGKRYRGSARFDPYYKIQVWDRTSLAWRDIQTMYASIEAARREFPAGERSRLMEITMQGRRPLAEQASDVPG